MAPQPRRGGFSLARVAPWLPPRWRKTARDLARYRARTLLAVLSMAVGLTALGTILGTRTILARDLSASFAAVNPASGTITTNEPFDEGLVRTVARMPEVSAAEGRRSVMLRIRAGTGADRAAAGSEAPEPAGAWHDLQLIAVPDFGAVTIDRIVPISGAWPPPERAVVVERSAMGMAGLAVDRHAVVKLADGTERTVQVVGTAHDQYALLYTLGGVAWSYISMDTLSWLGLPQNLNELRFVVAGDKMDKRHVQEVAGLVRERVEKSGRSVYFMSVADPGKHPLDATIQTILLVLGAIGFLALGLSALLVTNTVAALLAGEVRQIGVMKAVGARTGQVMSLYLGQVLLYGLLSLAAALPLASLGTWGLTALMAGYLNIDPTSVLLPLPILALLVAAGLLVPTAAAFLPVWRGTQTTVREAMNAYGLGTGRFGTGRLDQWLARLRGPSRPMLMALRNTFRRKARLALTVTTLTLAGAIFISVFSVRDSVTRTFDSVLKIWQYDLWTLLERPMRAEALEEAARTVPGVVKAEGWGYATARLVGADDLASGFFGFVLPLVILAPPAESKLLDPTLVAGRWLVAGDENAIVVNSEVLNQAPGVGVGDEITLKVKARDTVWRVVGVVQSPLPSALVYANYPYFARTVREAGRAGTVMTVTRGHTQAEEAEVAKALDAALTRAGARVSSTFLMAEQKAQSEATFLGIVVLLLIMAIVLAVVGGLGLAGALSLNVIERTREIGVMRAIGASDGAILKIILVEGWAIGGMSAAASALAAWPLGWLLSSAVGIAFFKAPLDYTFSTVGVASWAVVVVLLSTVASLLPARSAVRVSVREVLAYE